MDSVDPSPPQCAEPTAERLRWHCFGCATQVEANELKESTTPTPKIESNILTPKKWVDLNGNSIEND